MGMAHVKPSVIVVGLERIPERGTEEFVEWIETNEIDYFGDPATGKSVGREGWWGRESTYLRDAEYILWVNYDATLLWRDDLPGLADQFPSLREQVEKELASA